MHYQNQMMNTIEVVLGWDLPDVVDDPRVAGVQAICRSALNGSDPNCVPYDVFGGTPSAAPM